MGTFHTKITLKNAIDVGNCRRGIIGEQEIRKTTVTAMVDTGAATLVINEELRRQLGLEIRGERQVTLANDTEEIVKIAETVEVHWKNRDMSCQPWVISGDGEVLLGAIPLEDMDLIVDPKKQVLIGRHGDEIVGILK